jgi:hypothetical protein
VLLCYESPRKVIQQNENRQMALHQMELLLEIQETINTVKKQLTKSEKIFAKYKKIYI